MDVVNIYNQRLYIIVLMYKLKPQPTNVFIIEKYLDHGKKQSSIFTVAFDRWF